ASEGNLAADDELEASKIAIITTESTSNGKPIVNNLRALSSVTFVLDKNGPKNSSEHHGEAVEIQPFRKRISLFQGRDKIEVLVPLYQIQQRLMLDAFGWFLCFAFLNLT
ncbi:hypothetical protein PanWU01x14_223490, partial [Parasponia andersonii]